MEDVSHKNITLKPLNALREAQEAFVRAETNKKLCCPLKAKNWATTGIMYETGDKVYYK